MAHGSPGGWRRRREKRQKGVLGIIYKGFNPADWPVSSFFIYFFILNQKESPVDLRRLLERLCPVSRVIEMDRETKKLSTKFGNQM